MSEDGRTVSNSARIPVGEMAMGMLDKMFPHLSESQLASLRNRTPMPPSASFVVPQAAPAAVDGRDRFDALLFRRIVSHLDRPQLVSAVLAFDRPEPGAIKLARKAVAQFLAQTYPRKQLVFVNATDEELSVGPTHLHQVKEVRARKGMSLADLRNLGVEKADGEWIKPCWDDDDWYDPNLLTFMMFHVKPKHAVALTRQVRVDVKSGVAYVHRDDNGIPNTMIFPRSEQAEPFRDVDGEHTYFHRRNFGVMTVPIDNVGFPSSCLSLAIFHGRNKTPRDVFMGEHSAESGRWHIDGDEAAYVKSALSWFGFEVGSRAAGPVELPVR